VRKWLGAVLAAWLVATPSVICDVRPPPAAAQSNGIGLTPLMGWSSWSFLRHGPTAANVEAEAKAMVTSGLASVGYQYVNLDDFWYVCPGAQGPNVDRYGRWVTNSNFPPGPNGENGIEMVARYVHRLGLKFGLYVTPGISAQAVAQNTAVLGPDGRLSGYTADDIAEHGAEYNYNCKGMDAINYASPGAQDFIDSWADEMASWGIDYLKLDGVGSFDLPDVIAWSVALRRTGRPIHLELSNNLAIEDAPSWASFSNGWRTGNDVECYACEANGSSFPLTDWANVELRFDQVAQWQPYGGPGGFNDYDSIEVGNGNRDGLTMAERETQLSLWALASSPLVLGTDLTRLSSGDLRLLEDPAVVAVDQDAIDARRTARTSTYQIFAKKEDNGDVIGGLFNTGPKAETISTTVADLGLPRSDGAELEDLWSHHASRTAGTIEADVPPHGVGLYRITALPRAST